MDDLISRQAAIDAMDCVTDSICAQQAIDALIGLPSAERRGRWVESEIKNEKYVCSVCGGACWYYDYEGDVAKSNYCPNCGARMEV